MFQLTPAAFLFYLSASRLEPLRVRDRVKSADWAESAGFTRDTAFYFIYLLLLRGNHLKSLLTFNRAAAAQRGPNVLGFEINFPTGNSYQRTPPPPPIVTGGLCVGINGLPNVMFWTSPSCRRAPSYGRRPPVRRTSP